ncbi:MAG: hypothetical protein RAO94_14125 [Candidatus Stygibacter australis]|nr:hypothetical protein [Candidatus Stygibacter australis]MDP8323479.1 hypothetical protein [Candidatus Stygibacter australis]
MRKIIITLLMVSLIITPIFANPMPEGRSGPDPKIFIGVISVITLGLGYLLFRAFTNHDKVEFISEEITLSINDDNSVDVEGVYHFERTGNAIKTFEILYPFPDQKEYGEVEIKSVTINNREAEYYNFELNRYQRINLTLGFDGSDKCEMRILFTQKPENSSYKYILRSTRKWLQELEESIINVNLPASYILESNYPELAEVNTNNTQSEFSMVKTHFYPERDLLINWDNK